MVKLGILATTWTSKNTNIASTSFGQTTGSFSQPREVEVGLRLSL